MDSTPRHATTKNELLHFPFSLRVFRETSKKNDLHLSQFHGISFHLFQEFLKDGLNESEWGWLVCGLVNGDGCGGGGCCGDCDCCRGAFDSVCSGGCGDTGSNSGSSNDVSEKFSTFPSENRSIKEECFVLDRGKGQVAATVKRETPSTFAKHLDNSLKDSLEKLSPCVTSRCPAHFVMHKSRKPPIHDQLFVDAFTEFSQGVCIHSFSFVVIGCFCVRCHFTCVYTHPPEQAAAATTKAKSSQQHRFIENELGTNEGRQPSLL